LHFINKKYAIFSSHRFLTDKEKSAFFSYGEKTEELLFKKSPVLLDEIESMIDSYNVYQYEYPEDEPDYQEEIDLYDEELEEEHIYLDDHPWDHFDQDDVDVFVKYLAKAEQYYIREARFLRKQLSKPSSSSIKSRKKDIPL